MGEEESKIAARPMSQSEIVAHLLRRADAVLVGSGDGFCPDVYQAVYNEVKNIPSLNRLAPVYSELCQLHWLLDDPAMFFGFWGYCLETNRRTKSHAGPAIIRRWADELLDPRPGRYRQAFEE